ncbi:MAG TPA: ribonuclease H-like domain-containing protein, partial [Anaerolineales bacterium]|nr:ribonuclease H-like domain-containing protein [Anaerolineales bacterium]
MSSVDSPRRSSFADKLKSLGVKVGTTDLAPPKPKSRYGIDSVVAGAFHPTQLGEVFVAQQSYTSEYRHGLCSLISPLPISVISQWARDARISDIPLSEFAFLDTETSGLSGGTGTYAFLVGVARFVDGQFLLQQFFMRDPAEEPALLEGLSNFLAPCKALVTFNGKAFDAPLLTTRYSMHRIPVP